MDTDPHHTRSHRQRGKHRGNRDFIARHLSRHVDRWELCAFNKLCKDKYLRLGLEWPYAETPLVTTAEMELLHRAAAGSGIREGIAVWTGTTRQESREGIPEEEL
jgi:pyruvate formate lyase activating enzyme